MKDWQQALIDEAAKRQGEPVGAAAIEDSAVSMLMRMTSRDVYAKPEEWEVTEGVRSSAEVQKSLDLRNMLIAAAEKTRRCRSFGY